MVTRLPVIVGFGGVNSAGRASFHHAYRRTIWDSLPAEEQRTTVAALSAMMGLASFRNGQFFSPDGTALDQSGYQTLEQRVLEGSLIRRINLFDPDHVAGNSVLALEPENGAIELACANINDDVYTQWRVENLNGGRARLTNEVKTELKVETYRKLAVQSGGQLPDGFDPSTLYKSRFHPKGLQLAIIGASDAVRSIGIDWQTIADRVRPDEVAVYAASAMAQLDEAGTGGMLQARLRGSRVSAKQLPLGLNTMPADFVNAYVLGSVGATGANAGACATFLYNLRLAVEDIQAGRRRVCVVGNAEAPLTPEVIEGYAAMSALATDDGLSKLDGEDKPNHRRASRPFGNNCGFTLGESGQYFVLFDDELAIEMGANIHAAVPEVFVNADGFKKSISSPGPGNYITLAKAVAAARALLGDEAVRQRSFVQAHGSSTPQNRTTESRILNMVANAFGIEGWPVSAVKAFVGHSLAPASADQMNNTLGVMRHGVLAGIKTIDELAPDLEDDHLNIVTEDLDVSDRADVAFLNSKGFGGNNATGTVLSPDITAAMLEKRYGSKTMNEYRARAEQTAAQAKLYDDACLAGPMEPIYRFGDALVDESQIEITEHGVTLPTFAQPVDLDLENRYPDMS
ncbi:MAG: beta-ketoacyl synthase [Pseudomonadota bacterium]